MLESKVNLYESSLQLLWLLCARQHQVSAGVMHAQVIDVQTGFKHGTQALHPRHAHIKRKMKDSNGNIDSVY